VMGLGYPGGPIIDKLARQGNPKAFSFSKPPYSGMMFDEIRIFLHPITQRIQK